MADDDNSNNGSVDQQSKDENVPDTDNDDSGRRTSSFSADLSPANRHPLMSGSSSTSSLTGGGRISANVSSAVNGAQDDVSITSEGNTFDSSSQSSAISFLIDRSDTVKLSSNTFSFQLPPLDAIDEPSDNELLDFDASYIADPVQLLDGEVTPIGTTAQHMGLPQQDNEEENCTTHSAETDADDYRRDTVTAREEATTLETTAVREKTRILLEQLRDFQRGRDRVVNARTFEIRRVVQRYEDVFSQIRAQLDESKEENKQLKAEIKRQQDDIALLKHERYMQHEFWSASLEEHRQQLLKLQAAPAKKPRRKKGDLEESLDAAQDEVGVLKTVVKPMEEEIEYLKKQLKEAHEASTMMAEELETPEIRQLRKDFNRMKTKVDDTVEECRTLRDKIHLLTLEIEEQRMLKEQAKSSLFEQSVTWQKANESFLDMQKMYEEEMEKLRAQLNTQNRRSSTTGSHMAAEDELRAEINRLQEQLAEERRNSATRVSQLESLLDTVCGSHTQQLEATQNEAERIKEHHEETIKALHHQLALSENKIRELSAQLEQSQMAEKALSPDVISKASRADRVEEILRQRIRDLRNHCLHRVHVEAQERVHMAQRYSRNLLQMLMYQRQEVQEQAKSIVAEAESMAEYARGPVFDRLEAVERNQNSVESMLRDLQEKFSDAAEIARVQISQLSEALKMHQEALDFKVKEASLLSDLLQTKTDIIESLRKDLEESRNVITAYQDDPTVVAVKTTQGTLHRLDQSLAMQNWNLHKQFAQFDETINSLRRTFDDRLSSRKSAVDLEERCRELEDSLARLSQENDELTRNASSASQNESTDHASPLPISSRFSLEHELIKLRSQLHEALQVQDQLVCDLQDCQAQLDMRGMGQQQISSSSIDVPEEEQTSRPISAPSRTRLSNLLRRSIARKSHRRTSSS